ncbi:MAG: Arylsulfatase [Phycisphaerae bacterium]|nr:Arylsulfatase [Phycisphaerae bacterium]
MIRRTLPPDPPRLISTLLLALLTACTRPAADASSDAGDTPTTRPNIILISIDTLRADHLGCYGYPRDTSPRIDALARESLRFQYAYAQASWTLPSHMCLMTSQYPHVHGVQRESQSLADAGVTLAEALSAGGYHTAAFISWIYVSRKFGFAQGFDEFTELLPTKDQIDNATTAAYKAEEVSDRAARWLDKQSPDKPFFLFVHYFDPHIDYDPPPPFDALFDRGYAGSASGKYAWLSTFIKELHHQPRRIAPRDLEHVVALYDGEIRYVDTYVGQLLDALQRKVGLDNCLIVLTSDHGEELDDHGSMEGHQWTLYEEVIRVPLIIRPPGRRPRTAVVETPVELIDVASTLLASAGVATPTAFQGGNLFDLPSRGLPAARPLFGEIQRHNRRQFVRNGRYKLIHTDDIGKNSRGVPVVAGHELYDLSADPRETVNLARDNAELVRTLTAELEQMLTLTPESGRTAPRAASLSDTERRQLESLGYVGAGQPAPAP